MYTTGGLSTRMTESPPQAQQGFAEPTLELMYNLVTQYRLLSLAHTPHSSESQLRLAPLTQRRDQLKNIAGPGFSTQLRDSAEERS